MNESVSTYKICKRCHQEKLTSEYHKDKTRKDGLNPYCKQCVRERADWKNPTQRETRRNIQSKSYHENENIRKRCLERSKKYRETHKEYFQDYQSSDKFKDALKRSNKKRLENGKQSEYFKQRRIHDKSFSIVLSLRARIQNSLKGKVKSDHTINLLGCTIEEFRQHLENQFQEGMTWDNYGEWHVDHIIPCAAFDLEKEKNQRICFNFRNLQPLWADENFKKKDKVPENWLERIEGIKSYINL